MSSKIILLLGAGGNTGVATAKKFHAEEWKVVAVARSEKDELKPFLAAFIKADLSDPKSVESAFEQCEKSVGIPNVVTYNPYAASFGKDPKDPFASVSVDDYAKDFQVNAVSNYAAIKQAIAGFKRLPADANKVYCCIGNMLTGIVMPESVTLGPGKNASLYTVENALAGYKDLAKWYFVDERDSDGYSTMHKINGQAHADEFWRLANDSKQHSVNYTFVKGRGYAKFDVDRAQRPVQGLAQLLKNAEEHC